MLPRLTAHAMTAYAGWGNGGARGGAWRDVQVRARVEPFNEARRAYIRGDMKLIVAGGVRYQLFDLATDPGEKKDLSSDKELLAEQRKHYDQFRARLREVPLRPPRK